MTSELRWILLVIGVVFIAGLALWERRRPRQANVGGAPERAAPRELRADHIPRLREPLLALPEMRAREPLSTQQPPVLEVARPPDEAAPRLAQQDEDSPATPADVSCNDAEPEAELQAPDEAVPLATAPANPPDFAYVPKVPATQAVRACHAAEPPAVAPLREALPELPAAAAPPVVEWPPDEKRRIVALRLVAPQPQRFPGRSLRQALAAEGFVLGRFAIFHKPDEARRAVLSAASLNRPGTFDADTMDSQHYGGLSLFAVLPGPKSPPQAFDELVFTARSLNERLQGVLQDEQGGPLTPSRIASLREHLGAGATL
jgi:cell division protein ZipA